MQKPKNLKDIRRQNVLESLKDIGAAAAPDTLLRELLGTRIEKKYSGDITVGETLELSDVFTGRQEDKAKFKAQISLERNLAAEEKTLLKERSGELTLQLHALMEEIYALAQSTQGLGEEVEVASIQAPVEPGAYHVAFFEKLLAFIKSFRAKIESASLWLHSSNKRAEKKNYWAMYKKKGSSFLLAPDHYLQRSAG